MLERKKIVTVLGLESSGRHWVDSLLREQRSLIVWGVSYPCFSGERRCYPKIHDGTEALVVVVRDRHCQEQSVAAMQYNAGQPEGSFTPEKNREAIEAQIKAAMERNVPVYFFDYEAALIYQQVYMDWFFRLMGVEPVPIVTDWKDANEKYFPTCK